MTQFVETRPKIYSHLKNNDSGDKKENKQKSINCLENNDIILRLQHWFRSEPHNVFTANVKKTAR